MKRRLTLAFFATALLAVAALPLSAGEKVTVTGEVIDSACYIKMGAKGEGHRECAQKCADARIPLALLEDGTNKVIWVAAKADAESPNPQLREHAARKVSVTGEYAERGGARILVVESVKAAK
jgi:hypothetical protein